MSLRTELVWSDARHSDTGHVDFGGWPLQNSVAPNAFVDMAVSAYINSNQLAHAITEALMKREEKGLLVKAVVVDGLKTNMKAAPIEFYLNATDPKCDINHPNSSNQDKKFSFVCDRATC
ncbi:hypothetical protein PoB_001140300 [Plakobranchus ocellatus]|uniref:Uncharacterized protein n=1 Tax=Plakobranchus ocellatus TaxID=259542 RepID=A0AAV3YRC0_9GAST|nr:hypothetical protein PoB_001140300 [Plakobranchus ocellatus]